MANYRVISSDSHVYEPADLWTQRMEPKYQDEAPHIVREEDGDCWYCEGRKMSTVFSGTEAGVRFEMPGKRSSKEPIFENVRPGGYVPDEHVKDMDTDGVDSGVLYPTVGLALYRFVPGSELLSATFRAYNDWLAEFCKPYPSRLKGVAMINVDDVEEGVRELGRCAKMGLAAAMIAVHPSSDRDYGMPQYEPFWAAAQDMEIPISLHFTTNRPDVGERISGIHRPTRPILTNIDHWVRMSLSQMIFNGVFERFPRLYVGAVEHELSWAPHFLDRLDYNYTQRFQAEDWYQFKGDMLPSDYFHRNVFLSFQEDGLGIRQRDIIGVDNLLWGSDYPHPESTFPRSRQIIEEILADCTEEEKVKIVGGNAARVYKLD